MVAKPGSTDLLIAPPAIPDPRFRKAVIMITHDHRSGTFAICLNKTTEYTLQDIADEVGIEDCSLNFPLYWGGPVSPGTIWMLHSTDWWTEHTVEVNSEWSMTSHVSMFQHLADGDIPREFRLMYGYCSWTSGQLEAEVNGLGPWKHNQTWLVAENPGIEWVFNCPVEELWSACTELSGQQAVSSWL